MGRLNPERSAPVLPTEKKPASTIGPISVDATHVGSFVDFLRQATCIVDQVNASSASLHKQLKGDQSSSGKVASVTTYDTSTYQSSYATDRQNDAQRKEKDDRENHESVQATQSNDSYQYDNDDVGHSQDVDQESRAKNRSSNNAEDSGANDAAAESEAKSDPDSIEGKDSDAQSDLESLESGLTESLAQLLPQSFHEAYIATSETSSESKSDGGAGASVSQIDIPDIEQQQNVDAETITEVVDESADIATVGKDKKLVKQGPLDPSINVQAESVTDMPIEASQHSEHKNSGTNLPQQENAAKQSETGNIELSAFDEMMPDEKTVLKPDSVEPSLTAKSSQHAIAQAVDAGPVAAAPVMSQQNTGVDSNVKTADATGPQVTAGKTVSKATSTENTPGANQTAQVDRAKFVQRVSRAFNSIANQGGTVKLKLHPEELGALTIKVSVKQGQMTAQIETETSAAKQLIMSNLPALRERLAEQNIRIEQFNVDVGSQSGGEMPDQPQQDGSAGQHDGRSSHSDTNRVEPEPVSPDADDDVVRSRVVGDSTIDLTI